MPRDQTRKNPALFAAVLATSADDAPRLAYAKWLKDNGDKDRADFIISAIAGVSWLPQLVELHIQNSGLSDEVSRAILAWPDLPNLKNSSR